MNNIRNWWLNNKNVWFDSTELDDIKISSKFEDMFEIIIDDDFLINNLEHGIGYIILYDQISRHIKRAKKYSEQFILDKLEKILGFVKKFYSSNKTNLSGYDFCFVLLPLRHTNDFELQSFVIDETWKKIDQYNPDTINSYEQEQIQIYKNYLKASYERASNGTTYLSSNQEQINIQNKIDDFIKEFSDILDETCHHYKPNLEQQIYLHDILKQNKIIVECLRKKNNFTPNIILSISGGVDSMVLSWILKNLGINYSMVHINYANRGEICDREKNMLAMWANYLGIKLYIRDINEINRPKCMEWDLRNLYESYTRDVRYQTYIDVAKQNNWVNHEGNCVNHEGRWGIILGHNNDDCIENIFTNIVNKTKYENLYGMEFVSNIVFKANQLSFIRPMLSISKEEIYNFAHQYNIPYLFDSTPKWSQRGQIRDSIRPALINWNKSSIEGFDELSRVTSDCMECVDMLVDIWFNKLIWFEQLEPNDKISDKKLSSNNKLGNQDKHVNNVFKVIKIKIEELIPNKIFWSRLLDKIYSSNTSFKCLGEFISRIKSFKNKFELLQPKQLTQIHMGYSNNYFDKLRLNKIIYYWKTLDNYIIFGFDVKQ